ncbi:hypothetical protein [Pseudomonas sp. MGal98]|uniref:hypothetical protein n=1 Tax=Pseudomonas sp. MGal98 TaxID=3162460 RepID=UPI0032EEAED3
MNVPNRHFELHLWHGGHDVLRKDKPESGLKRSDVNRNGGAERAGVTPINNAVTLEWRSGIGEDKSPWRTDTYWSAIS